MSKLNKYGLSRTISEDTKRVIRQNSKFGCVICRSAIYTYEHINPVFVEAKEHDPEHMCLLCPNHQRDSTDGVISKQEISKAYNRIRNSKDTEEPIRKGFFDLHGHNLKIEIGPTIFTNFVSIINVDGNNFLSFKKDPDNNSRFIINGRFLDNKGKELFRIESNEWIGNSQLWDINIVGTALTIRRKKGEILFSVKKNISLNKLQITHLNMWAKPFHIMTEKKQLLVGQYDLKNNKHVYYGINGTFEYGKCALYLDSKKTPFLSLGPWRAEGGTTYVSGTGINIGHGAGKAYLRNISIYKSENCPTFVEYNHKRKEPQLFVLGVLETKVIKYPDWTEKEYYLYGYKLKSRPFSWGKIAINSKNQPIEVFHISGSEPSALENSEGFLGYWADDLLEKLWTNQIFECSVWIEDRQHKFTKRVKRSNMNDYKIENELNPKTSKWFHPHEFAGVSVWKK